MAAEGGSHYSGSDVLHDFSCSPCSKGGNNVAARVYCVECDESLCNACRQFHDRFEMTRHHKLLDQMPSVSQIGHGRRFIPRETCLIHHGKGIDMYCGTCDVVCCNTCIAVIHKACKDVEYIPRTNIHINDQEISDAKSCINVVKSGIEKLKKTRKNDLERIEKQKDMILAEIKDFRERINQQLDQMEKTTKFYLQNKYKKFAEKINADLKSMEEMISVLEKNAKDLKTFEKDKELNLFVYFKQSNTYRMEGNALKKKMENNVGMEALKFVFNRTITDTLFNHKALGTFQAYIRNQYYVKVSSDTLKCDILGSCSMADGSLMIVDLNNKNIKKLDRAYKVVAECGMSSRPHSVCRLEHTEVAITLFDDKKVQMAKVTESISMTRSFCVGDRPRGLGYSAGELFVLCGGWSNSNEGPGHVEVYDTMGTRLRSFACESSGQKFKSISLAVSLDGKRIHIAQYNEGGATLVTFDINGNILDILPDPKLSLARGVCAAGGDSILVCGLGSNNVFHIGSNGRKRDVLVEDDGIKRPLMLCYSRSNTRLIVSMSDNNCINVYDMPLDFESCLSGCI